MHRRRLEADLGSVVPAKGRGEFAIGDTLEAHVLLGAHDLADAVVLDCVQVGRREIDGREFLARLPEALGAKIAADMIGSKRRTRHWLSSGAGAYRPILKTDAVTGCVALATRGAPHRRRAKKPLKSAAASLSRMP